MEFYSYPEILENYLHATALLASNQEPYVIKNTPHPFELLSQKPDILTKFQKLMTELTSLTLNQSIDSIDMGGSQMC